MASSNYESIFRTLNLVEQARALDFARSNGFRLTCVSPEAEQFPVLPIEVVPPERITVENFPAMDPDDVVGLRSYWASAQPTDGEKRYIPVGFTPYVSEHEREAAALLDYMVTSSDETIELWGYPLERLPQEPKLEPELKPRDLRGLLARFGV